MKAQDPIQIRQLNLQEVIKLATDSSLNSFIAQNTYYAGYWSYRNFKAQKLPFLDFSAIPMNFTRQVNQQYNFLDSSFYYVEQQTLSSTANMSLNQIVTATGGRFYIDSDLGYLNNLNKSAGGQYSSTPLRVGFSQQLFGFNTYKWKNTIEPLKFEKAKKQLIESLEDISIRAVDCFFEMARAEINLKIASTNLANADTLYSIGLKRAEIAAITQGDIYTLKLDVINSRNNYQIALINLRRARMNLYSLLRLDIRVDIELILPEQIPEIQLNPVQCLELARENNPDILDFNRQRLEAERDVEQAKKNSRFSANLNASFGLNQQGNNLQAAYNNPLDQELVRVGINIPILDWGLVKGEYRLAQKNKEVINASLAQAEVDFVQTVLLTVEEFILQEELVSGAAEADTIAGIAYDIAMQRFIAGNADIVKLSISQASSIAAKRSYINALESYWNYYYTMRKLTLYDIEKQQSLMDRFDDIVGLEN